MSDQAQEFGAYSGYVSVGLVLAGAIYAAVNHKRVRSNCCGKEVSVSFDVEATTPPNQTTGAHLAAAPQLRVVVPVESAQS